MLKLLRDDPDKNSSFAPGRSARDSSIAKAFVEYLEQQGVVDRMACERATTVQEKTGERIDLVLNQLGLISERALLDALAQFCGMPLVSLENTPPDPQLTGLLGVDFLKRNRVVPLECEEGHIVLAVA